MNPIKVFWVEPSGHWVGKYIAEDGAETQRIFETEADGLAHPGWDYLSPAYRLPDGSEVATSDLPVGAMFHWEHGRPGPDGIALAVVVPSKPDGSGRWFWNVDSRCSNCDRKSDDTHYCWVRHGDPRTGNVHVDKNGNTCNAGAGSIWTDMPRGWHGFLHNGHLRSC